MNEQVRKSKFQTSKYRISLEKSAIQQNSSDLTNVRKSLPKCFQMAPKLSQKCTKKFAGSNLQKHGEHATTTKKDTQMALNVVQQWNGTHICYRKFTCYIQRCSRLIPLSMHLSIHLQIQLCRRIFPSSCGVQPRCAWPRVASTALLHSIVWYSIVFVLVLAQYSIVQYSIAQHSIVQYSIIQYSMVYHSIVQSSLVQSSVVQYSIVQYIIVQYDRIQHNKI